MRNVPNLRAQGYRIRHPEFPDVPHGNAEGLFLVGSCRVISSGSPKPGEEGWPWEHVSVSRPDRCPSWNEMCRVKDLFWRDDETVLQFHPAKSDYVNVHPFCLHLWRRVDVPVELPPTGYV